MFLWLRLGTGVSFLDLKVPEGGEEGGVFSRAITEDAWVSNLFPEGGEEGEVYSRTISEDEWVVNL